MTESIITDADRLICLNQAQIFLQFGRAGEAKNLLEPYIRKYPDDKIARELLVQLLRTLNLFEPALEHCQYLCDRFPDDPKGWLNLATVLEVIGKRAEAEQALRKALALDPNNAFGWLFLPRVALERSPETEAAQQAGIERAHAFLAEASQWLQADPEQRRSQMAQSASLGPFAAAYCPHDITPLLRAWYRFNELVYQPPTTVEHPPLRERLRLGLFTKQLHHQSVFLILLRGMIRNLDRELFELVIFANTFHADAMTAWAKQRADRFYDRRPAWLEVLKAEACDVLYYPDSTMDPTSVGFANLRLAPLQVTTWGHAASSAIPALDLFFSGELLEPAGAEAHYTEQLVLLPGVGACTPEVELEEERLPPAVTSLLERGRPVALLPHMPFKLVPADDAYWLELARQYPDLVLVFFNSPTFAHISGKAIGRIRRRFAEAGLDFSAHAAVIDWLDPLAFNTILRRADLYLDNPSFSGYTTAWQGVFAGIPIVTKEGAFLRQRLAAGLLRMIGITDTIAHSQEEYVAIVGKLLAEKKNDPTAWQARRERIRKAAPLACNDERVVRAFERVILTELALKGNPTAQALLPKHCAKYPEYEYLRAERRVKAPGRSPLNTAVSPAPAGGDTMSQMLAPVPVVGLTSPTTAPKESKPPQYVWQMLDSDLHFHTLSHDYAPVGLLEMIPQPPRAVFDLGCFVGTTGKWLKQKFPDVRLVGVEMLAKAAQKAQTVYDEVFVGKFEDFPVDNYANQFDAIIAADVLEHLYNPWQALLRLKKMLAPGGALYISLPNIRNLRVLEGLASNNDWRYEGAGILDITHIRFFTRISAVRMLNETGWQVLETRGNLDPALKPMVEGKNLATVRNIESNKLGLRNLADKEAVEFFTLQWFFRCQPL